jgi:predicted metal-dependent peptidase
MLDADKDKDERKLKKVKIGLMRNKMFALYQGVMMVGKTKVDDKIPTAYTNGRDEVYGRKFIRELDEKELAFVVMHETMHKIYRHITTWKKLADENALLCNAACDYVINLKLKDLDQNGNYIRMPMKDGKPFGLIDEKYRGMHVKQVFDMLKQQQEEGGGGGGDEGFDEHGWDDAEGMTAEEKEQLVKEIDRAIRQGQIAAKKAGVGTGGMDRELAELIEPRVDWREVLREFVKSICNAKDTSSWRRVNRRFLAGDTYLPTLIGERVGHIVIGVDTSGSIGVRELSDFLSEVKGIADEVRPERVDLLYWDSEVAGHEEYDETAVANIVSSTKPQGGGGTSPSCVTAYLKEKGIKPECVIMLTDGYVGSDWGGDWESPVLWAIVGGNTDVAPVGKTVHVKD